MNICPCRKCIPPKRHLACHGSCTEFTEYNEERLRIKGEKNKAKNQDAMIDQYVISQSNKYQHRKQPQFAYKAYKGNN